MIAKEKCAVIVMLTELVENGEEKCVKYWPDQLNEWVAYDSVKIHVTEENRNYQGLDITHRIIFVLKDVSYFFFIFPGQFVWRRLVSDRWSLKLHWTEGHYKYSFYPIYHELTISPWLIYIG